ncbi:MAG: hypothetical protein Ta2B_02960 [Termitinemataceae bacterium]|nr:MAG: hypothetical protein Ta2B_02960 [Termitinemataceae bacterium]
MKKSAFLIICVSLFVLSFSSVYGQGYTGPGAAKSNAQVQNVTVVQAKGLPDNSLVILTGTIVQSLGKEKFTLRDSTGDITVEIDRELWALLGISVSENDKVEIGGKVDVEKRLTKIDVKYIKKI